MLLQTGIVTFHGVNNYGAVLQTYALVRTLKELEASARVIDYKPDYLVAPYRKLGRRPMVFLANSLKLRRFQLFRKSFIPTSSRLYRTAEELYDHPPKMDAFICGSDQVWNLNILRGKVDESFFLGFAPQGTRTVAYAPSFGDWQSTKDQHQRVRELLGRIQSLSARETEGKEQIQQLTGREATLVLDPSLLVRDYQEIILPPKNAPKEFIVTYRLERSKAFDDFVCRARESLGLPVVNISQASMSCADFNYNFLGPREWLGWLYKASYVCTNSFHGTAFSVIFRKNFASFQHQHSPKLGVRSQHLLGLLNLGDRFVTASHMANGNNSFFQPVQYSKVEPLLEEQIRISRKFLQMALHHK